MKKPEEMDNKLVFSEKYKRFVKLIAGAIVLVSIAMAFAGVFVRNRQFDFAAKIMFLFLALIGFSVLIVFLSGTFERFYRKDRGGDGLSGDMVEDALLLTDASGHIINANAACRNLTEFDKSKTVFSPNKLSIGLLQKHFQVKWCASKRREPVPYGLKQTEKLKAGTI